MSLETLQKRIKTTQEMREIISTMKSLSSASILQYDQANIALSAYLKNIRDAFHGMIKSGKQLSLPKAPPVEEQKTLTVLIGSDTGLVGRFNKELVENALSFLKAEGKEPKDCLFITVGKRPALLAEQRHLPLFAKYAVSNSLKAINSISGTVIVKIEQAIREQHISRVIVFYHRRIQGKPSLIEQRVLLPFSPEDFNELKKRPWPTNNIPQVTLSKEKLLNALIDEFLMIVLSGTICSSLAAEHYVRMVNMQNAEKNIDESLERMKQELQQKRQDEITEELIDVVSGSEAINNSKK